MWEHLRALVYNCLVISAVAFGAHELSIAFSPIIGLIYAFFILFMLYYVLRKQLCTNCVYYGKLCYTGWGWLASKLFTKSSGNFRIGMKAAGITWAVFLFLPLSAFGALHDWWRMFFWIALIGFFIGDHFGHCLKCPMKEKCLKAKNK